MKIRKAVGVLTDILTFVKPGDPPEEHEAIKLSIEALLRVEDMRISPCTTADEYLPGETKE